ncbi:GNAT family N-acetyltransferase [Stappia sp. F7233]|uniref:GNAT family N-acetyltransferase n=1 Tax=Stappia albiluteola TaxID=2758565 RepID=A0A839AJ39_9HYPH|nr:GNAT family N-acetyltransferase [Stappia albiluteola]MBA5778519.1 GNAT family N-acetyltransferase [Stappia albiluteola]
MRELNIRPFHPHDTEAVIGLFVAVNRELAPSGSEDAFARYIDLSIAEEMGRLEAYYGERGGSFHVAMFDTGLVGMFGLEPAGPGELELRRMYVAAKVRRTGIAREMLARAEEIARRLGAARLVLSTSELQQAALGFYRSADYILVREEVAETASNKTIGGGIRRFHFEKLLG